jgi:hypothetical protein
MVLWVVTETGKSQTRAARAERLRAALRENLKRRKAQARSRAPESSASGERSKPVAEAREKD